MVVADESWDAYPVRDVCEVGGGVCVHGTRPLEHAGDVLVSTDLTKILISEHV